MTSPTAQLTLGIEDDALPHKVAFTHWLTLPGARHILRDLYALASKYVPDWKRSGIPVSVSLLFEEERHLIKRRMARAQRLFKRMPKVEGYTLNNNLRAYIARHMMERKTEWEGLFEVRELAAPRKPRRVVTVTEYDK